MLNGEEAAQSDRTMVAFGTVLDHFAESEELTSLVDTLPHICREPIALEASQERFTGECACMHKCCVPSLIKNVLVPLPSVILDKYQEQPHLLDPYLGEG